MEVLRDVTHDEGTARSGTPVLRPMALAAVVAAALLNVPPFVLLDRLVADEYEALRIKPGHTPAALVSEHFDSTRTDIEVFVQLRSSAPGAGYVVPAGGPDLEDRDLVGLARSGPVLRPDGPPRRLTGAEQAGLAGDVVATGVDERLGPYAIALRDDEPEMIVVVAVEDGHWLVDERLLPGPVA